MKTSQAVIDLIRDYYRHYPTDMFEEFTEKEIKALTDRERWLVTRIAGVSRRLLCKLLLEELGVEITEGKAR